MVCAVHATVEEVDLDLKLDWCMFPLTLYDGYVILSHMQSD